MCDDKHKCKCFSAPRKKDGFLSAEVYEEFAAVRDSCAALNKFFIPDRNWEEFQEKTQGELDKASHQSILLLAYTRGYLHKLTSPIHRYLLDKEGFKKDVGKGYKADLQEKWLKEADKERSKELRRHQGHRGYRGKLAELQCAEWLEAQGWKISSLEALGGVYDIEAVSPEGVVYAIEVKFIGQDDDVFLRTNELDDGNGVCSSSPYKAHDFLLVKIYDAACQFIGKNSTGKRRVTLLVVENMARLHFQQIANDNWISIKSPSFKHIESDDEEWLDFIRKVGLDDSSNLSKISENLDEIWIVAEGDAYIKGFMGNYHAHNG